MIGSTTIALVASLAAEPDPDSLTRKAEGECLARMEAAAPGEAPTFASEIECQEWEAIVLLEGDLRTATTAWALCERARSDLARVPVLEQEPEDPGGAAPSRWWHVLRSVGGAALGGGAGAALGYAAAAERPIGPVVVGGLVGALFGALVSEVVE